MKEYTEADFSTQIIMNDMVVGIKDIDIRKMRDAIIELSREIERMQSEND